MISAVLFDLGGTLAAYYARREFPALRDEGIAAAARLLVRHGGALPQAEELARRVAAEDYEAEDHRVRPLEDRLAAIFADSGLTLVDRLLEDLCAAFMAPIFARGTLYDDALPTLSELRGRGLRLGLVSNTPWGSPAALWRDELSRLGLAGRLDCAVFCRDAGWRKPAAQIFSSACGQLDVEPPACLFVGDHPRWDVDGAQRAGLHGVQLCRRGVISEEISEASDRGNLIQAAAITGLSELTDRVSRR